MEFDNNTRKELFNDLTEVEFIPGNRTTDKYKYKALIPRHIWNKWRPDNPLKRNDYKIINFGRNHYQQYKDIIGYWSDMDHKDKKRRANFKARHEPIRININGKELRSYLVPFTNEFFSYWLLW